MTTSITRAIAGRAALSIVLAGLALCAGPAGAQEPYVALEIGPSFFADSELSSGGLSADLEFDPGFAVGGAIGARIADISRAELRLSYRRADTDEIGPVSVSGDVGILSAMANGYVDLPVNLPVQPYVGIGIGVGVLFADFRANSVNVDDEDAEFAYNVMAGVAYELTESVVLDAGYRYFATTDADIQGVDAEIDIHELLFGVRYEF